MSLFLHGRYIFPNDCHACRKIISGSFENDFFMGWLDIYTPLAYYDFVDIEETSFFTKHVYEYLSDDEYCDLQIALCKNPGLGRIIPGTGGIRKLRWGLEHKGKRGGCRIIYYWFNLQGKILLLFIYPKSEQEDLSTDQIKILGHIVDEEKGKGKAENEK